MSARSLLLVLVIFACLQIFTKASDEHPQKTCCFDYQKNAIPLRMIKTCKITEHQCTKPGVIFILNDGGLVCADPKVEWVKELMKQTGQCKHNSA